MSWTGALGAKGLCSEGFVVVPEECRYCKLDRFKTKERATDFLKENHRIKNIIIITEKEYVDAWNERFANETMNGKGATGEVGAVGGCRGTGIDWGNVKPISTGVEFRGIAGSVEDRGIKGEERIEGTLSQLDLSKFPDGTRVVQVGPPLIIDIPDSYIEAVRNSHQGSDADIPYNAEDKNKMLYRKSQLAYLNGR